MSENKYQRAFRLLLDDYYQTPKHWEDYQIVKEAVDAVEVVFCKDCIYQKDAKVNCKGFVICPASNMEITDDDYCSYGERKESEDA